MPTPLTNDERQSIRTFMGFPTLVGANPEFDSILDAVNQSINNDGGSCINQVRAILANLQTLDTNLKNLSSVPIAMNSEGTDFARQEMLWRYVTGPSLVQELSIILSFPVPANYFAPAPTVGYGTKAYRYRHLGNQGY